MTGAGLGAIRTECCERRSRGRVRGTKANNFAPAVKPCQPCPITLSNNDPWLPAARGGMLVTCQVCINPFILIIIIIILRQSHQVVVFPPEDLSVWYGTFS